MANLKVGLSPSDPQVRTLCSPQGCFPGSPMRITHVTCILIYILSKAPVWPVVDADVNIKNRADLVLWSTVLRAPWCPEEGKDWELLGSVGPDNMDLVREAQVTIMSCVTSSKLLHLSEPLFPCPQNWGDDTNNFVESLLSLCTPSTQSGGKHTFSKHGFLSLLKNCLRVHVSTYDLRMKKNKQKPVFLFLSLPSWEWCFLPVCLPQVLNSPGLRDICLSGPVLTVQLRASLCF